MPRPSSSPPDRQPVEIRIASLIALKLWVNGKPVAEYPIYHSGSQMDQYRTSAVLEPGRNLILVKVCQNEQTQDSGPRLGVQAPRVR